MTNADSTAASSQCLSKQFEVFYKDYHTKIYANISGIVRDSEFADDILQEVFITLWQHLKAGENKESVAAWLFVVSKNMSLAYLRQRKREQVLSFDIDLETKYDDSIVEHIPDDHCLQLELIRQALPSLSPRRRQAFILNKLQGRPIKDVATFLKTKPSTVKEYLKQSVRILRKQVCHAAGNALN